MKGFIRVTSTEGEEMLINISKIKVIEKKDHGCSILLDDPLLLMKTYQGPDDFNNPHSFTTRDYEYSLDLINFHESIDEMFALIEAAQQ